MNRTVKFVVLSVILSVMILPLASCKKEGNTPAEKVFLYASQHVRETFFLSLEDYSPITMGYAVKYTAASFKTGSEGLNMVIEHAMDHNMAIMGQGMKVASVGSNVMYYSSIKVFDTLNYGAALDFAYMQGQVDIYDLSTGTTMSEEK